MRILLAHRGWFMAVVVTVSLSSCVVPMRSHGHRNHSDDHNSHGDQHYEDRGPGRHASHDSSGNYYKSDNRPRGSSSSPSGPSIIIRP